MRPFGRFGRIAAVALAAILAAFSARAPAQGVQPPPGIAVLSPSGVSFGDGSFHLKEAADLSIGGEGLEQGLHLAREYQSGLAAVFSSGLKSQGWTHNLMVSVTRRKAATHRTWPAGREPYLYSVSVGGRSATFVGGSDFPTGGWVGTYTPVLQDEGTSLAYSGTEQSGTFTFTDRDGSVLTITDLRMRRWALPSGVVLTYDYNASGLLISVSSSRGYALLFEGETRWTGACAVNLAYTHAVPGSSCPAGAPAVAYAYSGDGLRLTAATDAAGKTTEYEYSPAANASRMTCVRRPGQPSACQVANQYSACQRDPALAQDPPDLRLMDRVVHQQTGTGETYAYQYSAAPFCPSLTDSPKTTMTASGAGTTEIVTNESGAPVSIKDALGRTTINAYPVTTYWVPPTLPSRIQLPEGNAFEIGYVRGNVSGVRAFAKPGSGEAEIHSWSEYDAACANVRTCNRPRSATDARGNKTEFDYDPTHGGLTRETGPLANGLRPETRHLYAQRRAWTRDAGGGYQPSAAPIWVRAATSFCRASQATGNPASPCLGGDEVLTTYDYGPDSGPNTLLLRSETVVAGNESRRTCYGYDRQGNRISTTRPKGTCP